MRAPAFTALLLFATIASAQAKIETFPVPAGHLPTEIARYGDGMTFISWKDWPSIEPYLGRVTPKGKVEVQELAKDHMPGLFSQGPDGTMWLSGGRKPVLWHVLKDGKVEQVQVGSATRGIAVDADGGIWVTHPERAEITRYGADGQPQAQWFVGSKRKSRSAAPSMKIPKATRIDPKKPPKRVPSDRSLTREERRQRALDARPSWIVVGPDDAAWFSEPTFAKIGRVTAAGEYTRFDIPNEWGEPRRIIDGPDGALWFALTEVMALGRITPDGEITTIDLPYAAGALATDSKKRVWFTDASGAKVGYVDPKGNVHEVPMPEKPRMIRSLAEGPDGAMWFADQIGKVIGKITL